MNKVIISNLELEEVIEKNEISLYYHNDKIAYVTFPLLEDGAYHVTHTIVNENYAGKGIAKYLMEELTKIIISSKDEFKFDCSYAKHYFDTHNI
jgi:hypothetical protein